MKKEIALCIGLLSGTCGLAHAADVPSQDEMNGLYNFAYPLVLMELTKHYQVKSGVSGINTFAHYRKLLDNDFDSVVTVNVDTLYSIAHLSLEDGPVRIEVPVTEGFYYMMPILDGWTNVIAEPGTRTTGTGQTHLFVTGPGWQGEVPEGYVHIASPTNLAWAIGRFRADNEAQFPSIHALQDKFSITTEGVAATTEYAQLHSVPAMPTVRDGMAPDHQLSEYSAKEFFATFCELLENNPPNAADQPMMDRFTTTGLVNPGCATDTGLYAEPELDGLYAESKGIIDASLKLLSARTATQGWRAARGLGEYGTNYTQRALTAKLGLGANKGADAIYPGTYTDSEGQPLDGHNQYVLHFEKEELPPVKGFWSLTAYDKVRALIENPGDHYSVSDRSGMTFNDDGSLTIYIQHEQPEEAAKRSNWIYVDEAPFNLVMRLYWPSESILSGEWNPPLLNKVAAH